MSFEAERLRILERVSNGELSPKEGSLEIAMLRVHHERTDAEGLARPEPGAERQDPWAAWRDRLGASPTRISSWPLLLVLALPLLVAAGFILGGLALVLALPTLLLVAGWNTLLADRAGWPELSFWPTLGAAIAAMALWTALRWRRRLRVWLQGP